MADNEDNAQQNAASDAPPKKSKLMTILVVAGLMAVEGVGIFIAARMIYGKPAAVEAAEGGGQGAAGEEGGEGGEGGGHGGGGGEAGGEEAAGGDVEVALPELKSFNKKEGRMYMCSLQVTVRVSPERAEAFKKTLEARKSTVEDRLNTVIRSSDVKYLNEPGLETIRRQFKSELDKILGDEQMVLEVLIPRFMQAPAGV